LATTNGGTGLTSFTSGGVVYASSTSALATGATLTYGGSGGNLTVGANGTAGNLEVGAGGYGLILSMTNVGPKYAIRSVNNTDKELYINDSAGGFTKVITYIDGSEATRLTSTGLGIGTSSPSNKLHVTVSAASTAVAAFYNTDTADGNGVYIKAGGSNSGKYALAIDNAASSSLLFLDSSGNLGLGVTPSAWASPFKNIQVGNGAGFTGRTDAMTAYMSSNYYYNDGDKYIGTGNATLYTQISGQHIFYTAPSGTAGNAISFTQAMTLDASGNLGVGETSPSTFGRIVSRGGTFALVTDTAAQRRLSFWSQANGNSENAYIQVQNDGATTNTGEILFATKNNAGSLAERARITSGGYFKASNNGTYASSSGALHELKGDPDDNVVRIENYQASLTGAIAGVRIIYSAATPNTTTSSFLYCNDSTALRAEIRSNGGLANYSGNDVNLSDRREKTNFAPAKSYLDTICAIPVQTFNYIDQSEDDPGLTLGVVAQDVQAVAPELVMESNWGTAEEPKMRLSIYQTDLQYALMKCVQELKAELDSVKAELATLKGQP
jgi:hypothetical protein